MDGKLINLGRISQVELWEGKKRQNCDFFFLSLFYHLDLKIAIEFVFLCKEPQILRLQILANL